jgi:hypothetical protein
MTRSRFERPTPCLGGRSSIQLSYRIRNLDFVPKSKLFDFTRHAAFCQRRDALESSDPNLTVADINSDTVLNYGWFSGTALKPSAAL